MNIDEMTPQQLGAAAAKEVMGWTECCLFNAGDRFPQFQVWPEYLLVWDRADQPKSYRRYWAAWRDMNDCMEAVLELRKDAWRLVIRDQANIYGDLWRARLFQGFPSEPDREVKSHDLSLPVAILRAALQAVRKA